MTPKLSIIIINFRSEDVLVHCLRSLHVATETPIEVILIDNSPDGGAEGILKASGIHGHYFPQSENLGYARAANIGARHAVGEFLCFLNPDTVFESQALERMLAWLQHHRQSIAGPRELDAAGTTVTTAFPFVTKRYILGANLLYKIPWPRRLHPWLAGIIPSYRYARLCRQADRPTRVPVLSGSCLVMPRAVWQVTGDWRDDLTYFGLESEWFERARDLGMTAWYIPAAKMFHEHATSIRRAKPWEVQEEADRNRRWYAQRKGWLALAGLPLAFWIERKIRNLQK